MERKYFPVDLFLVGSGEEFKKYAVKKYQITVQGKIIEVKDGWLKYEYEAVGKIFSGSVSKNFFRFLNRQGEHQVFQ
ncbi:MAG TPA: hypothetical protein PKN56_23090 [Leptospiraceae bacterium]|nr:hypothetical protein [Leptospiraceae bacterium]HNN06458.1 hypothetical protein [Leptospiraceae bacterium]